ncbi:MAG: hypothetical protein ACRC7N_15215 [Clostridium sp.]
MKKRLLSIFLVIMIVFMIGCGESNNQEVEIMDMKQAQEISGRYLQKLYENNIDGAKALLTKDLNKKTKSNDIEGLRVTSYKQLEEIEAATYIASTYMVTRASDTEPKATVDMYNIKVIDENGQYKIKNTEAKTLKSIYGEADTLRVRRGSDGDSELLIRLKDLPSEIYLKDNGAQINKYNLPNNKFGVIGVGNTGSKVAITTNDGINTYIAIIIDEEAKASFATVDSSTESSGDDKKTIDQVIEKPVAQQLSSIDLIKNGIVQRLQFDSKEEKLIVQYKHEGKGECVRVYNASSGELITLELDKKFDINKYNVQVSKIDGNDVYIRVSMLTGENDDKVGEYKIESSKLEVIKQ